MPSASKPRAKLSEAQALTVFQARASASTATKVAVIYGVSEKAVRDIWTGRTWSRETWHLDTSRPLRLKTPGRPKGCRDTKPRMKRANCRDELSASTGSTAQVPSGSDIHGVTAHALEQDASDVPLNHRACWMARLAQRTVSAACFEYAVHQPRAGWWTTSTLRHASVDEQLREWDEFWRSSTSVDPFCGDWSPC